MKRIVMIGPARGVRGGVSAMVNVYFAHGLFARWPAEYLASHCDGSKARKAWQALKSWIAFMGRLVAGRVALLHVNIASDASFWRKSLFILPAHLLRVPYLLHMHGGNFVAFYRSRSSPVQRFIRWVYRNARAVIALSDEWRDTLASIAPGSRLAVIPNPVEIPPWQATLAEGAPTVLFLGVIKEHKGVNDLLRAWPAVRAAIPAARLVLAGSGDVDEARTLARDLGVQDSVETPGWIRGDAKHAVLGRAWAFALPSYFEGMPMSILEAMAAGVPVVATKVGGIPMAVDERCGVLIPPRDAARLSQSLIEILGDASRRKAMGAAARERAARHFSAAALVPRVEQIWEEIVGSPNGLNPVFSPGHG
jgi:glycosyltransferase involved in cell wall biosynthesis